MAPRKPHKHIAAISEDILDILRGEVVDTSWPPETILTDVAPAENECAVLEVSFSLRQNGHDIAKTSVFQVVVRRKPSGHLLVLWPGRYGPGLMSLKPMETLTEHILNLSYRVRLGAKEQFAAEGRQLTDFSVHYSIREMLPGQPKAEGDVVAFEKACPFSV